MLRWALLTTALLPIVATGQPPSREQRLKDDRVKVEAEGFWIYNDLAKGFATAKQTGMPLLVVLRCIPCDECVKLDDELVNRDPTLRPLLEKFVCVRQVSTNGLDLGLFQFDTDQSFAAFMLNADGTVYGRFGTRSHRTQWLGDVSLPGLAKALQGALDLQRDYPGNNSKLVGKRGPAPEFASPEKFPSLKDKYGPQLSRDSNIVKSCIHCHQIGDAQRQLQRTRNEPMPAQMLFPFPHPKTIGLILDPNECATVKDVVAGSSAAIAGFQAGDTIRSLAAQPLLSIADVQWVLHHIPNSGSQASAVVLRGANILKLTLQLPAGWRTSGDLSWRSSSWGLRRMTTGGMLLEDGPMGLRVKHVGQFGPHAAAKQAGFRVGDVIVEYDGRSDLKRETDLLAHGMTARKAGDRVPVVTLRDGQRLTMTLPMQN